MTRDVSAATLAASLASPKYPIVFVELQFRSETSRIWSGRGELDWNGETWLGLGTVGAISPMEETNELRAAGLTFQLSGIDPDNLEKALIGKSEYRRRRARVWLGFTGADGFSVVAEPIQAWSGMMDVMSLQEGDTYTAQLTAESDLIDLERARTLRYLPDEQKARFPGDLGLDYIASLQDATIEWPNGKPSK